MNTAQLSACMCLHAVSNRVSLIKCALWEIEASFKWKCSSFSRPLTRLEIHWVKGGKIRIMPHALCMYAEYVGMANQAAMLINTSSHKYNLCFTKITLNYSWHPLKAHQLLTVNTNTQTFSPCVRTRLVRLVEDNIVFFSVWSVIHGHHI